ncbi:Protein kinase domain-containing protein [Mycena kentingensis (nom. inval.)]|nr:Protein kinase domain-containing protein [Mycena kentingensis (nom. inval.)]
MNLPTSDSIPDLTGELIDDGALELVALLGCGAYGTVYKARDTSSPADDPRFYAVKCMRRHLHNSRPDRIQRNELRIHRMASDHPRVITFHRAFTSEDLVFVVLAYASGGDFFSALVDRELFRGKPALIKKVFNEICDGVEFLHRNSIYHRDIKPENILCDESGLNIRLADFGLATQAPLSREFGCGSRFYMSPESLDRNNAAGCVSARSSDMWALSVIFTNLISGRHPWSSADTTDQGYATFRGNNNYLYRALNITREANALLKRCFDSDPRRRPTIAQMRASVNEIHMFAMDDEVPIPAPLTLSASVASDDAPTPRAPQSAVMQPVVKFSAYNVSCSSSASSSYSFVTRVPTSRSPSSSSDSEAQSLDEPSSASDRDSSPPTTPASSVSSASHDGRIDAPSVDAEEPAGKQSSVFASVKRYAMLGLSRPPPMPPAPPASRITQGDAIAARGGV